ncbi:2-succinyl-5-enolpyruvyl-6-hydroxy-3-cyclohexene-1-carboxylic-acid synthase [Lacicoccus alkaliphilus]|uniref:2-succinyl-5-enolpyruvyl-6-hydroxy-3-cyclohexene-1-carboxylate synthase n=1 Tax=Lacicoccus alkaliphilus DSM 16010 TaxID=1123231 RepID=A0A1M7ADK4_9BACL|nr:2-succinyl-5-enolpyruvyl-6-hydroxy-3-cyclohexene-1-carboxylic-acid synthase [Salinicoccus alkaliphilus]SHL40715.1 2-succinyl-5-enolpyruvyl-6-hydroxy-3-cyclohexene-1-carboxylate synthase [Salinicoccus alkaliphilus DSM 16010]
MNHQDALTIQIFTLIDCLYEKGMEEVVISPGSRSTPLALAAELHPGIKTYIHPDERSAAFFGLGLGKKDRRPVGLICTSGTASANYTPAVAEAGLSRSPLVVLTSDRPAELQDIGAPQAINQADMYRNYVSYYTELPVAEGTQNYSALIETRVLQAAEFFTGTNTGPVHFNIPIREPLMPDLSRTDLFHRARTGTVQRTVHNNVEKITGNILIILGETAHPLEGLETIFSQDNVTVIADPRQHARLHSSNIITTHDLMFSTFTSAQLDHIENDFDYIVRVGEPVTSKLTNRFLANASVTQILVSEYDGLKTFPVPPARAYTGDAATILKDLIGTGGNPAVKKMFSALDMEIKNHIEENIRDYDDEGRFMYEVIRRSPDDIIFASSSMPIRDVERYDMNLKHKVYANRGANGIDGVVSTAMAMAVKDNVTLVIGDIALYHDMNGLVMSKLNDIDINIIVFNNDGGGIFSFLPQYEDKEHFERLFGTPLGLDFSHTARLYDFNYTKIESVSDLEMMELPAAGRNFIEIMTDRAANLSAHQSLKGQIGQLVKNFEN